MKPLVQVQNFSVQFNTTYGHTVAVNNITFDIGPNEIVAVVGESGSGKSVTALAMLQLLPAAATTAGNIIFQHKNLLTLRPKAIQALRGKDASMIFQEPMTSLNPVLTCGKQVTEAILTHTPVSKKMAIAKTIELFEKVKLPNPQAIYNRYPHQLSGGQKQRVMIAMAMSCNPALLIADEPTTALDVTVQKEILQLIQTLQQQNSMSVLLITHDLGVVADVAHRIIVMYKGEIVEQGMAKTILLQPQHPYTQGLLQCRPGIHAKGTRLPVLSGGRLAAAPQPAEPAAGNSIIPAISKQDCNSREDTPLLEVQHLKVYYPGKKKWWGKQPEPFKAVDDTSFTIQKGEIVGLVGESGCGKSTLGKAILQLVPSTSGKIILNGVTLTGMPQNKLRHLRKNLQVVFQDPYGSLNPRLTIGEAILEPMLTHGLVHNTRAGREQVAALLEKVKLEAGYFGRYPHQFSGGQRQRICIARALALQPSFLIFDESVSALDVSVQAQVLNLLHDLKKEFGFTAIFISHDISVVHYISDRIMVMHQGKIVEQGDATQVYTMPRHAYTKTLLQAMPGKSIWNNLPNG
ncbi:MAG TPA: ABC transporter ATP-binding protein [Ferruginibacter sp.]|nr:ABC transporter ATP-binding protein [Ferruginibacter sp.]HMP20815.1 ABC transporter ATP-binding protein [Ferruginibacter sp.]